MTSPTEARRDRSADVKGRIRTSASRMFAQQGFTATGVREIAAAAGVDPAIVIRHFGSKEALFLRSVTLPDSWGNALAGPVDDLGRSLVRLIASGRGNGFGVWAALMRASDRPDVGRQFKSSVTELFAESIVPHLNVADAELRAHLFAAQLEGLLSAMAIREDAVLLNMPLEVLVERYGALLQQTLTGPPA